MRHFFLQALLQSASYFLAAQCNSYYQSAIFKGHMKQCLWESDRIGIYNEDLCKGLEAGQEMPSRNSFQEAEVFLETFYSRLKSFIAESLFDVHGFEAQAPKLYTELIEIEVHVKNTAYCDEGISRQLAYIQLVFQQMADSIEALKYYEVVESPGRQFICSAIDLNLSLLTLKSSYGGPDFAAKRLKARLISLRQFWELLRVGFDNHGPNSFGRQMMFDAHYYQADRTLQDLERYVAEYKTIA